MRHVVAVMSGKGGVGKSLVSAGLAAALAADGRAIGLVDADLHGPTAARMLGVRAGHLVVGEREVEPPRAGCGVRVMSSDLLLAEGAPLAWREPAHDGFVWRGTLAAGMLREFLGDVAWGALDLLLVDMPPGSERLDTLAELVPGLAGVVVVTIPSDASYRAVDARGRGGALAAKLELLGVIENMAGYRCGGCQADGPAVRGRRRRAARARDGRAAPGARARSTPSCRRASTRATRLRRPRRWRRRREALVGRLERIAGRAREGDRP